MIHIREERPEDAFAVRLVNEKAFGQTQEANIVEKLRQSCDDLLSLVAVMTGHVVGHVLFSPATIESNGGLIQGMALAPMAVLPAYQRQGIGSRLVQEGIKILRSSSCPFVIVLGHPDYYPRFGFEVASKYNIMSQWQGVPEKAFMILILDRVIMEGISGVARYRSEFSESTTTK
jgi:putative acetyltransferase